MGRRYYAILKHLGVEYVNREDPLFRGANKSTQFSQVIVATPTESHFDLLWDLIENFNIRAILCEKPICKEPNKIQSLIDHAAYYGVDVRMVCNWSFVKPNSRLKPECNFVDYDCYNTGKDGLAWDCIQLIYLANGMPTLKTKSPTFKTFINRKGISLDDIANSYVRMIEAWLKDPALLWSLEDAKKATEKTLEYIRLHPIL